MKNVVAAAVAISLCACGGPSARHFRVVSDMVISTTALPDECKPTVTTATTQVEQMTNSFCGNFQTVPNTSGSSSEGIKNQEDWTIFEADGKAYLVRSAYNTSSGGTPVAIEGTRAGTHYVFISSRKNWTSTCVPDGVGPVPRDCNGVCVNTYGDRTNCGTCGNVCAPGQGCNNGSCGPVNCSMTATCGAASVNLATDTNNCGYCGQHCPANTVCSPQPYGAPPTCVPPSMDQCTTTPVVLPAPMLLTNEGSGRVEFDVNGSTLLGSIATVTAYTCESSSCVADFAGRCPSCTITSPLSGSEAPDVQALQLW